MRWIRANADQLGINPDYITAYGGSAGANLSITIGVSREGDCVDELSVEEDPTLASTHLEQSSKVATVIDNWGGTGVLDMLTMMHGHTHFDETDAPISIAHGTRDSTVPFEMAETLQAHYEETGVPYAFHPLEGVGHGQWNAEFEGRTLNELAFDFIVEQQGLTVE